jgi:hypothetical protein
VEDDEAFAEAPRRPAARARPAPEEDAGEEEGNVRSLDEEDTRSRRRRFTPPQKSGDIGIVPILTLLLVALFWTLFALIFLGIFPKPQVIEKTAAPQALAAPLRT